MKWKIKNPFKKKLELSDGVDRIFFEMKDLEAKNPGCPDNEDLSRMLILFCAMFDENKERRTKSLKFLMGIENKPPSRQLRRQHERNLKRIK